MTIGSTGAPILFGDEDGFGVRYARIGDAGGRFLSCHFTYLIGGRKIGNYDFAAPVAELEADLNSVLQERSQRRNDALAALTTTEIAEVIEARVNDDLGFRADLLGDQWRRHLVGYYMGHGYPPGTGKHWTVLLVESERIGKLVFYEHDKPQSVGSCEVPAGQFDAVLLAVWEQLCRDLT